MKIKWYYVLLILFSITILGLEYNYGQNYIRNYLTDIKGPVLLYGLQTTITTVLLVLCSYNFIITYISAKRIPEKPKFFKFFFLSQAIIFMYLAIDERFMLHERIAFVLNINDAIPLLSVALVELIVFYYYRAYTISLFYWNSPIVLGSVCFVIMLVIDCFAPLNANLRLSAEDLFKLWGIFFFFRYSYKIFLTWVKPSEPLSE